MPYAGTKKWGHTYGGSVCEGPGLKSGFACWRDGPVETEDLTLEEEGGNC